MFDIGQQCSALTARWLGWEGYAIITLLAGALSVLAQGFIFGVIYTSTNRSHQSIQLWPTVLSIVCGLMGTLVSNVCSMAFTGTFPDASSAAQNATQNALSRLKDNYSAVAKYMLLLYAEGHKDRMVGIAKAIDLDRISEELRAATTQTDEAEAVFSFFRAALVYLRTVQSGVPFTSHNTELELLLRSLSCPLPQRFGVMSPILRRSPSRRR